MALGADKERFGNNLEQMRKDAAAKMNDLDSKAVPISTDWDRKNPMSDAIEVDNWGEGLVSRIESEARRVFEKGGVDEAVEEEQVARVTQRALSMAVERYGTVLGSFPEGKIADQVAINEFWQRAAMVLKSIDEKALMYESALEEGSNGTTVESFYRSLESYIPRDFTAVVERTLKNELTEADREYMAEKFLRLVGSKSLKDVYSMSTLGVRTTETCLLFLNLDKQPAEKTRIIEMIAAKPGGTAAMLYLTVGGFITVAEAEQVIDKQLAHESDPDRIEAFEKARKFMHGDNMERALEGQVEAKQELAERSEYLPGHKNQAKATLTYRGIGGLYVQAMAGTALVLSALTNWRTPVKFMTNPMTIAALGAGSLGAAINPSDINLWPKPGTHLSRLLQDKTDREEAEQVDEYLAFKKDMLNHTTTAELYYNVASDVELEVKRQVTEGIPLRDVKIDLASIGVDYEKLHPRFKTSSKEQIEARFTDWAQTFHYTEGLNRDTAVAQREYMDEMRPEFKLEGRWPTYNLSSALV